ncbi:MAG: DUF2279 domain-containing protein [Ignavibacteriales bacterium]|nr:DUF2279 domain-containing protein [Ignavibacteriales bacterium]
MKTITRQIAIITFLLNSVSLAESGLTDDSTGQFSNAHPSYSTAAIGFGATVAVVHFTRYVPLWDRYKTSFFTKENSLYASNYDKALHFYGGVVSTDIIASGLRLQGYEKEEAVLFGAAASTLFYTYIEIEDAHINYLGFDGIDLTASVLGAGYPVLQHYVPFFNSFTPKFSYQSSGINTTMAKQYSPQFLSDHEGQTYWMGVTVADLLPASYQASYPRWLGVAAGFSMRNLGQNTRQEYFVTLDVDLRAIDTKSEFLNTVLRTLNYIHFPMPGIKFANGKPQFGIYF